MLFLVFNSAIRNPKSELRRANFFMDDINISDKVKDKDSTPCPPAVKGSIG
jgi:hypothetical protein